MFEEFLNFADYISNVNDLTVFNKTGSTVLDVSKFHYDFLSDHNFFALNQ
jgi:hypothetical protein